MKSFLKKPPQLVLVILVLLPIMMIRCLSKHADMMSKEEISKLDPRFQTVIAKEIPGSHLKSGVPAVEPAETLDDGTKIYSVIIRTKDAKSVKDLNIRVNSVLPSYVTARVTARQLIELTKLKSVSYLDAGQQERIDKK